MKLLNIFYIRDWQILFSHTSILGVLAESEEYTWENWILPLKKNYYLQVNIFLEWPYVN